MAMPQNIMTLSTIRRESPGHHGYQRACDLISGQGLNRPFGSPVPARRRHRALARGRTPWDAFPDTRSGKMDAETCALTPALEHPNLRLETGARVVRLAAGPGGRIDGIDYVKDGERRRVAPRLVALCAGAVMSAAILLASAEGGLANRSGAVGRHFMNHNLTAMLAIDPGYRNDSVYQKTIGFNDFYFDDGAGGPPLGNVQLLGKL